MPDTKITALTAIGANPIIPSTFPIPMVDLTDTSMASSGTTKKVTVNQILGSGGTATLASATITGAANFNGGALAGYLNGNLMFGSSGNTLNLFALSSGFALKENTGTYNLFTAATGGFVFGDGAGGTRMTLNSTGLGVGGSVTTFGYNKGLTLVDPTSAALGIVCGSNGFNVGLTSSGGPVITATNSQSLSIVTGGSTSMVVNSSGNVGIANTPTAGWRAGARALQLGANRFVSIWEQTNGSSNIGFACYESGSNALSYTTTGDAPTLYSQISGTHKWYNAASGTAGNAITFTQAMTLDASGNLLVGTTSSLGSSSNSTRTVGGVFVTAGGSTASTASGSAVTLFTAPNEAVFMVSAYIFGTGSPSAYNAVAIVKVSGGSATITTISSATGISVSLSGLNVQATQTSGSSQVIAYSAIRIS